jgi:hypothetical protein
MNYPTQYAESDPALKKRKPNDPLVDYFGGTQAKPQQPQTSAVPPPPTTPARTPQPSTNVGQQAPAQQPVSGTPVAPAPPAASLPPPPPGQNPAPTNFVNYQRYFNANRDVSQRTAGRLQTEAQQKAIQAQARLQAAQRDFQQKVAAGTLQGPGSGAQLTPEEMARAAAGYTGPGGLSEAEGYQQAVEAAQAAGQNLAQLGDDAGVQALLERTGGPGSKFAASLAGTAGRRGFDALRATFNPAKDGQAADAAAAKQVADATAASSAAAGQWQNAEAAKKQRDEEQAAQAERDAARAAAQKQAADRRVPPKSYEQTFAKGVGGTGDTEENRQKYMMTGVDMSDPKAVAARQAEIDAYKKAQHLTDQQQLDRTFNDINTVFSPSNWIANALGVKDPTQQYAQKQFNPNGVASQTGSTSNDAIPWDRMGVDGFFVWRSMTPEDWKVLNSKPLNGMQGQRAWIENRAWQLRQAQAAADAQPKTGQVKQA